MALLRLLLVSASLAAVADAAPAITSTISGGPAPQAISGGLSTVTVSYMVSGIVNYSDGNGEDIASGIAASLVSQGAQVNASQIDTKDTAFAVAGSVTLMSARPRPGRAGPSPHGCWLLLLPVLS